ncbi:uncharacterized protein MYCFIDRAFT_170148 [Pseudocercospora fijiensis CIRAD86]|uniref:Uncharacterized protein n=1 Tax=Pseudocercospora fijiensis (strain CIRAD86) TaxID=383855 RepID=N1Q7C4_PSEFD|nr:uncharacterized protein MYCFIDRAFT_170148 [Pseudocercospora fijiensis CIRAD86]EME88545.1 hypothetical protein MYCFIDRAFT_170148 [Pseudocercospora fijiensis CIRAD86]
MSNAGCFFLLCRPNPAQKRALSADTFLKSQLTIALLLINGGGNFSAKLHDSTINMVLSFMAVIHMTLPGQLLHPSGSIASRMCYVCTVHVYGRLAALALHTAEMEMGLKNNGDTAININLQHRTSCSAAFRFRWRTTQPLIDIDTPFWRMLTLSMSRSTNLHQTPHSVSSERTGNHATAGASIALSTSDAASETLSRTSPTRAETESVAIEPNRTYEIPVSRRRGGPSPDRRARLPSSPRRHTSSFSTAESWSDEPTVAPVDDRYARRSTAIAANAGRQQSPRRRRSPFRRRRSPTRLASYFERRARTRNPSDDYWVDHNDDYYGRPRRRPSPHRMSRRNSWGMSQERRACGLYKYTFQVADATRNPTDQSLKKKLRYFDEETLYLKDVMKLQDSIFRGAESTSGLGGSNDAPQLYGVDPRVKLADKTIARQEAMLTAMSEIRLRALRLQREMQQETGAAKESRETAIYVFTASQPRSYPFVMTRLTLIDCNCYLPPTVVRFQLETHALIRCPKGMNTKDIRDLNSNQWLFWVVAIPLTTFFVIVSWILAGGEWPAVAWRPSWHRHITSGSRLPFFETSPSPPAYHDVADVARGDLMRTMRETWQGFAAGRDRDSMTKVLILMDILYVVELRLGFEDFVERPRLGFYFGHNRDVLETKNFTLPEATQRLQRSHRQIWKHVSYSLAASVLTARPHFPVPCGSVRDALAQKKGELSQVKKIQPTAVATVSQVSRGLDRADYAGYRPACCTTMQWVVQNVSLCITMAMERHHIEP